MKDIIIKTNDVCIKEIRLLILDLMDHNSSSDQWIPTYYGLNDGLSTNSIIYFGINTELENKIK